MKKKSGLVKIPGSFIVVFVVFFIPLCFAFLSGRDTTERKIDDYFRLKLEALQAETGTFLLLDSTGAGNDALKKQFTKTRKAYKELAVLTDYFNPYESRFLNSAALQRVEEDNPDNIIPPHGFQAVEEMIFGREEKNRQPRLHQELNYIRDILDRLASETDRSLKFRDEAVFDALRSAVLRLMTLGITGADSPLAQQSLEEAGSTITGIENLLQFYRDDLHKNQGRLYDETQALLAEAKNYLSNNQNFLSFDRLAFITRFADPLFGQLGKIKTHLGLLFTGGRRPVHPETSSVFAPGAFDIRFFSPDEQYQVTPQRVELGRRLFFDPILSESNKRSCAGCHKPELAFTDGMAVPLALDEKTVLKRNTPTLWNSALQTRQFFDSRADVLENQLDEVVHNTDEMKGSLKKSVQELKTHPVYAALFKKAYAQDGEAITAYNIANAISSYIRTLVALNSRFDQYMRGDETKLSQAEINGFNLFMGKAKCATCHFIPLFNGLAPPEFNEMESEVIGVPVSLKKKVLDPDLGKFNFTRSEIHRHSFKTPTLRNIALTAPYMHNGAFRSLNDVMQFYNKGGGKALKTAPENLTLPFDRLNLSKKEMKAVESFLKALTDTAYIYRP
jgi:cytochrome c peroxidase